jgi:hypothetical protein
MGTPGHKGDLGEKGERGMKGPTGPEGPKGEPVSKVLQLGSALNYTFLIIHSFTTGRLCGNGLTDVYDLQDSNSIAYNFI